MREDDRRLHALDREVVDLLTRYDSEMDYEANPFVPEAAQFEALQGEALRLRRQAETLQESEHPWGPVLGLRIHELMESFASCLRNDQDFPHRFMDHLANKLLTVTLEDGRSDYERYEVLRALLEQAPQVLSAVLLLGDELPPRQLEMLDRSLAAFAPLAVRLRPVFSEALPTLHSTKVEALDNALTEVVGRIEQGRSYLGTGIDRPLRVSYQETLENIYGVPLQYLLDHHEDEVQQCREELYAAARNVGADRDPFDILQRELGPCDDPEELFPLMEQHLATARQEALRYISLPEGESCHVRRIPEYYRETNPWGGYYYYASGPLTGNLRGAVFVNEYNYKAVTRGWLMMLPIHECYPGHHAQYVKTAAANMPLCFRASSSMVGPGRGSPLAEGIAHRAEKLLEGIYDDATFPVFVAYRRLHTAVRISVDLLLHHHRKGIDQAAELYRTHMQFSEAEARGQVLAQEMTPGYFTVYNYGMRALDRLQKATGWKDPAYTEAMFSSGKVSLSVFERVLRMDEGEREGLLTRFYQ